MRPENWATPERPRDNVVTFVNDDLLTCLVDLRCPGEPSRSQQSLLIANSRGWRPFVGSGGCELLIMLRKPLLGAHPDVLAALGDDCQAIHSAFVALPQIRVPDDDG